jgi:hypothetical protein
MSLSSLGFMTRTGGYTTTLANKLDKIDCSQVLDALLIADKALLGHIKMGKAGTTIEHNWIEDQLNQPYFYAKYGTTLRMTLITSVVSSTQARLNLRSNSVIQREGTEALWLVTSTISAIGTMTVTKAYGNSPTIAKSSTVSKFFVVAQPWTDIADASSDISRARNKRRNFMQIFERAIEITKTRENMSMEAMVNELQYQIQARTMEIKRELNISLLRGAAYYSSGFSGRIERSTMQGIERYLWDPDMDGTDEKTTVIQASAALTQALINTLAYQIYDKGGLGEGSDPIIVVGPKQQRVISGMEKELRRVEAGEKTVGYYKSVFLSDLGTEIPVVVDRWCSNDKLLILDRAKMSLIPMQGDSWGMEKMAKTGRSQKWQLSGQYTLEMRYPDACHGALYDLS